MARVQIASLSLGCVEDGAGNKVPGQTAAISNASGAGATVYAASTGSATTIPVSDGSGYVAGWLEEGSYTFTIGGLTHAVAVVSGSPLGTFNVRGYGATGDGTTDDTTAVQAAIADAAAAGGGVVYLPAGTYLVGGLTVPVAGNVALEGAGFEVTFIKLKNGANADVIQTVGFAGLTGTGSTGGNRNCAIRRLTVNGNKANQSSGYGIRAYGFINLSEVIVRSCKQDGIVTDWGSGGSGPPGPATFVNVSSYQNDGSGWSHKGPNDAVFYNVTCSVNGLYGFINGQNLSGSGGSNADGAHISKIQCWGNGQITTGLAAMWARSSVFAEDVAVSVNDADVAARALFMDGASNALVKSLNAGGGIGLELKASEAQIDGNVQNSFTSGLKLTSAANNQVKLQTVNTAVAIDWNTTNGGNQIQLKSDLGSNPNGGSATLEAGTPSSSDFVHIRADGGATPLNIWRKPDLVVSSPTYGATVATDVRLSSRFKITVTDGNAFTISNPTNVTAAQQPITYDIVNSSGGAMGAVTWGGQFKLAGAFTNPASTKRRTISFHWDGTAWVETARAAADI